MHILEDLLQAPTHAEFTVQCIIREAQTEASQRDHVAQHAAHVTALQYIEVQFSGCAISHQIEGLRIRVS